MSNDILPLNYLMMWSIELLLCFEMQMIRVKLTTDDAITYKKKMVFWKIFRFVVLLMSTCFNLLQIWVNNEVDLIEVFEYDGIHNDNSKDFN
jgi:hypothetical protein